MAPVRIHSAASGGTRNVIVVFLRLPPRSMVGPVAVIVTWRYKTRHPAAADGAVPTLPVVELVSLYTIQPAGNS